MKKNYTSFVGIALTVASVVFSGSVSAKNGLDKATMEKLKGNPSILSAPGMSHFDFPALGGTVRDTRISPQADTDGINTIGPASVWGTLNGPDGNEWLYFQENVIREGTYSNIESSTITVYDFSSEQVGQFTLNIPEDQAVNDIQVFGYVTSNFFDNNSSTYEITVYFNQIIDYTIHGRIEAYSLDGTQVGTFAGSSALYYSNTANYSTYQRYLFVNNETVDGVETTNINVYAPVSWQNDAPVLEHTFSIPTDNLYYSDGPYANVYFIDDQPYFVISHYENPYMTYGESWEMEVTPDNNYLIDVYDENFEEVASLKIPVAQGTGDALYTFYTFGYFSYNDLCRGTYSGDEQLNFIVSRYDYVVSSDDYLFNFDVYNEAGEIIATIGEDVYQWKMLSDIEGKSSQVALMRNASSGESIEMVDLPSCQSVTTFPGTLNGDLLSTAFDRYPVNDTYQYVFGLGNGYDDGNGNVITRIGWYNIDTSLDHFVDINLGPNAVYASHQFVSGTLNPYLFNTDNLHEYIFIAIIGQEDGTNETMLCIANDNGEIIRQFDSDPEKGDYNFGYLSNANASGEVHLFIGRVNDNRQYTVDVYALPFSKFEGGGTGTAEDPYIISTPGDLDQIRHTPSAHYALGNDLDMNNFYGSFNPIDDFSGSLDGRGHNIDNLSIDASEMYSGLFQGVYATDVTIKDITFNNAVVNITPSCSNAGVVAGYVASAGSGSIISNIHVNNAVISADNSFNGGIGGIVGMLTSYSSVEGCSVNNILIDAPSAQSVGGIVGETRTSSSISASRASGIINAGYEIGGILGTGGTGYSVSDCYADFQISGGNTIGGIVGRSARSTAITTPSEDPENPDASEIQGYASAIQNCYATGSINATESDFSGNFSVGGIAGSITSKWTNTDVCDYSIYNCLAALDEINIPEGEESRAVGRIIGFTIADEEYLEDEEVLTESGLVNNYALASMTLNGTTITSDDATSVAGADVASDALTTEFFTETLAFAYGNTNEAPWKETSELPILYFEERAMGLTIALTSESATINGLATVVATVEGASADRVVFTSSDTEIAEVIAISIDGNTATATIRCHSIGNVEITASIDGLSESCSLAVSSVNDIVVGDGSSIKIYSAGGNIYALSATHIDVYSLSGSIVAQADGEVVETGSTAAGIYVVVATDDAGNRAVQKVIVK